jgi:hypothetical protein
MSTFDDTALREDGWVVTNDAESRIPTYVTPGGNPGGFIETTDAVLGYVMWFKAPRKFLGDQSAAYGSLLTFDLKQTGPRPDYDPRKIVKLKGGGIELYYDAAYNPGSNWTSYQVALVPSQDPSKGWMKAPAVPATEADLRTVLGSLSALKIRGEFRGGPDTEGLDNVVLGTDEVRVHTYVAGAQSAAKTAVNAAGQSVVVWHSQCQDGSGLGLYAQRYDGTGNSASPEFRVNTVTAGDQYDMSVAMAPDGSFVVAWCGNGPGDSAGVFARRFDSNGNPRDASEFRVNENSTGSQGDPSVGIDAEGNFVVAWQSLDGDGTGWNVYAQKFRTNAARWGLETRVNTTAVGHQLQAQAAMDESGNYVVAWLNLPATGEPKDVYARLFASNTAARGPEFRVSPKAGVETVDNQYPSLSMASDGRFVVVWNTLGNGWEAMAQRYDAAGNPLGQPFYVADGPGDQYVPTSSMNSTGAFAVTWQDNRGGNLDVYARQYGADGQALGAAFPVNVTTAGTQAYPSPALDGAGRLVVVWSGNGPGDADGVFARRFVATGNQATGGGSGTFAPSRAASIPIAPQAWLGTASATDAVLEQQADHSGLMPSKRRLASPLV